MGVKLYLADVSAVTDAAMAAVPAERRQKAMRFALPDDRRRSLGAGLLLQYALTAEGIKNPVFGQNEHGKPLLLSPEGWQFSLSHAGSFALCAVSHGAVGCDIEKIDKDRLAVAKRFFAPEEAAALAALPETEQLMRFYRYWTAKESYVKALGKGLSMPLDSFAVTFDDAPRVAGSDFCFKEFFAVEEYAVCLCAAEDCRNTVLQTVKL